MKNEDKNEVYKLFFHKVTMVFVNGRGGPDDALEEIRLLASQTWDALCNEPAEVEGGESIRSRKLVVEETVDDE